MRKSPLFWAFQLIPVTIREFISNGYRNSTAFRFCLISAAVVSQIVALLAVGLIGIVIGSAVVRVLG